MSIQYYIIDLESNGTKLGWHEVTQISIIRCIDRHQLSKNIKIEYPDRSNPRALQVTGQTKWDLMRGDPLKEVVESCDKFIKNDGCSPEDRCIVGHNIIKFDKKFLHHMWEKCGLVFPANLWMDTIPFIKSYMVKYGIDSKYTNLEASLEYVGVELRGKSHSAKMDTRHNYLLWKKLMEDGIPFLQFIKRFPHKEGDE